MGFMDELRKLTQPIDDEEDFFEGANINIKPAPGPTAAQLEFENTFGEEPSANPEPAKKPAAGGADGGIFGGLSKKSVKPKARKDRPIAMGGGDTQVIFSPKSFDEAGALMEHLLQGRSVVMTLDGLPIETARRLLDFLSGITFALQGKITPISAKTYFVTPQNVDIVGAQSEQPVSDGQYF